MNGDMNGISNPVTDVSAIVAKQRSHPRHALILQEVTLLPQAIMEMSLAACFEQQVAQFSQRLAVATAERTFTYAELNGAANRLAHHLLALGIPVTTPVTIILESSHNTIISILAVLKTGGYHLCLEPTLPVQRARDLLNRAGTQMILTTSALAAYVEEVAPSGSAYILLDQVVMDNLVHNPEIAISPHQLVRLGFTSGSTGTPKPSLKIHQNYLYSAWESSNSYLLSPADRHAFVYQFSTGMSMRGMFCPLLTGGSVHLHPGAHADLSSWAAWIEAQEITQLTMPTAAFRELLHTRPDGPNFPSVRTVYITGQTAYCRDGENFQRRFCPGTILVSRFGMSETSGVTHYPVDHDTKFEGDNLPCGYALPGRELLIVDEDGRPLGPNQVGEIVVKNLFSKVENGDNSANRTGGAPGAKRDDDLYVYTADLGLLRPDGCLIHLGRKDDMVKVRGNRVALAEAESLLLKVGGVAQAAVKAFPTNGDNQLVGYVTPAPNAQLTASSVRTEVSQLAPTYMVPARIVVLPQMPMTTTGKVDRQALPPPGSARPDLDTPFVAPRNEVEHQIADIWAELLELDTIGTDDNFFELGGNSITAVRMILRVETTTGSTIPHDYFRTPTVATLAALSTPDIFAPDVSAPPNNISSNIRAGAPAHTHRPSRARDVLARLANGQLSGVTLLRRMIYWRAMGLPYAQAVRWWAWLGQPAIANRLFRHERAWFRALTQELANPATMTSAAFDKAFSISVLGNLVRQSYQRSWLHREQAGGDLLQLMRRAPERFWRTFAQQFTPTSQAKGAPLFHFSGLEYLVHAQKRKRGTILVTYHSTASGLANIVLAHQTNLGRIPTISQERADELADQEEDEQGVENGPADWGAISALYAQRILQNGGVVRIVNDVNYDAANSLAKVVGQRRYNLKPGLAELALTTGATVLPVYSTFDSVGGIHTTILPALVSQATTGDTNAYVHDLLDHYVAFLEATWRNSPESIGWGALRRYNNRPLAGASPRSESTLQAAHLRVGIDG